jgi:hypothetical protein
MQPWLDVSRPNSATVAIADNPEKAERYARAISQAKRVSSVRVSIGDTREMSTRIARATAKEYLAQISRGQHPNPLQNQPSGSGVNVEEKTT